MGGLARWNKDSLFDIHLPSSGGECQNVRLAPARLRSLRLDILMVRGKPHSKTRTKNTIVEGT